MIPVSKQPDAFEDASTGEVLLEVSGVSKRFCRDLKRSLVYGVQDILADCFGQNRDGSPLRQSEFWALNEVSFQLRRGECIGLIGANGAGKTTLLRIINGLIKPDHGYVRLRGRVGALIALGAGFNPVLTGRENIFINAAVLGFTRRDTENKLESIIEFAGIGDAINAPVQSYSSGMQVRLGFAIAAHLDPDILLIDEVLAVGDAAFRDKCYRAIDQLRRNCAVIFVSHNLAHVARICNRAILLTNGSVNMDGDCSQVFYRYIETTASSETGKTGKGAFRAQQTANRLKIDYPATPSASKCIATILNSQQTPVCSFVASVAGDREGVLDIPLCYLNTGRFFLSVTLLSNNNHILLWEHAFHSFSIRHPASYVSSPIVIPLDHESA